MFCFILLLRPHWQVLSCSMIIWESLTTAISRNRWWSWLLDKIHLLLGDVKVNKICKKKLELINSGFNNIFPSANYWGAFFLQLIGGHNMLLIARENRCSEEGKLFSLRETPAYRNHLNKGQAKTHTGQDQSEWCVVLGADMAYQQTMDDILSWQSRDVDKASQTWINTERLPSIQTGDSL